MAQVKIATAEQIPEGEARRFSYDSTEVAVANLGGGEFRALDAICSHALSYLDEGEVDPDMETIECAKHGSTFDLNTGRPRTLPATQPVRAYQVTVDGDDILIEVND
jgi:3-phenylpropionate/trans-cinnamate dioxygenase ferredoxin component